MMAGTSVTSNRCGLILYSPSGRIPNWGPFSPPLRRKASPSWKRSQSTERAMKFPEGIGAPVIARTTPTMFLRMMQKSRLETL